MAADGGTAGLETGRVIVIRFAVGSEYETMQSEAVPITLLQRCDDVVFGSQF
jgi:hypothetical protein